jgi:choline transport protein
MMKEGLTDDLQLAQMGHAQSFERQFSRWTMLGLAFAILNSWTALAASLSLALPSGGSISVIWGLVVAGICNLSLAASLAEFLSAVCLRLNMNQEPSNSWLLVHHVS